MLSPLYVGIDVSAKDHKVQFLKSDGNEVLKFSVPNSLPGAKILSDKVVNVMSGGSYDSLVVGLEATSVYGDHLVYFMKEDASINKFKPKLHVLNPKQVANFKKAYPDLPKNDWVDAWVIADNLRFGRITKEVYMGDYRYDALQNLTRARFLSVQNLSREKSRFLNYLFMKFSSLAQEDIFSNTFGATSTAIIEEFHSVDEIVYMDIEDLANFISNKGKGHFADPKQVAEAVKAAARSSYRLPKTVNDSVNQVLAISMTSIRALMEQIKLFDKAIEQQIRLIPNTLTSVKGIGPVYSAGIIAEIGDIHRFKNQAALAKYAGLAWTQHQSGQFTSDNTRLIRSGNRFLKYYLFEAANSLRVHDQEFVVVNKKSAKKAEKIEQLENDTKNSERKNLSSFWQHLLSIHLGYTGRLTDEPRVASLYS